MSSASLLAGQKTVIVSETLTRILTFIVPKLQRNLSEVHIQKMVDDQRAEFDRNRCFSMVQSITVASLNGELYVLDGQHRLQAFSDLLKMGYPVGDVILPVIVYYVNSLDELACYYNRINQHMPIHPLELTSTWDTYEKPLVKLITTHYEPYLKESQGTCRCPHINLNDLKRSLQDREVGKKLAAIGKTALQFWNDIDALNSFVKTNMSSTLQLCPTMSKRIEDCEAKATRGGTPRVCYLGIWRHFEWLDICLTTMFQGKRLQNIDMSSFANIRRKIPTMIRQQVWEKHNLGGDSGSCFVCESELEFRDMECGHVVAHALGGGDTVANLMPTCKTCNRDMGIMNLMDYKAVIEKMSTSMKI
jgi:hypothetical protein